MNTTVKAHVLNSKLTFDITALTFVHLCCADLDLFAYLTTNLPYIFLLLRDRIFRFQILFLSFLMSIF